MTAAEDKPGIWFIRIPSHILNPNILNKASAADLRVYLTIARHQGFRTRQTFPLSIEKIAEESICTRRSVFRAIDFWISVGALLKKKKRRLNFYEIPKHCSVPPGIGDSQRHFTPKNPNRDKNGRYVPLRVTSKVTAKGTCEVTAKGTHQKAREMQSIRAKGDSQRHTSDTPSRSLLQKSLSRTSPPPPHGGGTSGHQKPSSGPRLLPPSPETIKEFIGLWGEAKTREYLLDHGYSLPERLIAAPKGDDSPAPDGSNSDIPPVPQGETMDSKSEDAR